MENKNNPAKLIAAVGGGCLVAGILIGMLIMKAFFMPETVVIEVPAEDVTASVTQPEETEPVDVVIPSDCAPESDRTDDDKGDELEDSTENAQIITAKIPAWETAEEIPSEITMSFSTTYVDVDPSWPLADF